MEKNNTAITREDIPEKDKWTIDEMFPEEGSWDALVDGAVKKAETMEEYHGKLGSSASVLLEALKKSDEIDLALEKAFAYARMKLDEDNTVTESQARYGKIVQAAAKVSALTSFLTPEIVLIPEEMIDGFLNEEDGLKVYEHLLRSVARQKEHVLTEKEENILANLGEVLGAPDEVFTMLNDADLKFGKIKGEDGEEFELTHGNYVTLMRSHDRTVRQAAYTRTYEKYQGLINTISANYRTNVETDAIGARLRKYENSRAASLFGDNIPGEVYDNLVTEVNNALPSLHEYISLRKKILGVDELRMYDMYVPLVEDTDRSITFDDAVSYAKKGLSVLGDEYIKLFMDGVSSGWIDKYENPGKTSGAYSFGSYDSKPYVLMNFDGTLEDLFTLVHEMGHSMNSYYTRKTQPFCYGDHSIFTAEVASTVNETLMMRWLLENEEDPEMKKYILNMYIEAFRTTLFRQTMFAEFEDRAHELEESGETLTNELMSDVYDELNSKYFGPELTNDDLIRYEWARIPHFYRSFYVYQYATGYSAANAIADRILEEGEPARKDYIEFLKCGTNDYPIELLKIAGVDMSSPEPVRRALSTFGKLVKRFGEMI